MQPRFIIYLFAVNALMNGIGFVPRILLTGRHDGAYAALLGAFLLNLFIILFIFRLLRRFPQKDLSSILAETIPPLLRVPLMIYFVLQWLIAGSLSVIMVAEISAKYLNVGASGLTILYLFIILVLTAARLRSDRVLFALELSFIMTLPLLFLIVIATFTTQGILWKSIVILLGEGGLPDWEQLSAASYVYIGYINILLFNKVIQSTFRLWKLIIGIMVIFILYLFLFSLPIALLGTEAVAHYHYPWVITADSLRIEHAPIERAFYPALIGYLNIALLNTIVHWHVTLEFLKSLRPASGQARSTQTTGAKEKSAQSTDAKQKPAQGGGMPLLPKKENLWQSLMMRLEFWVLAAYGLTLLPFVYNRLPIDLFYELNRWWLRFLLPNELLALLLLVWSAWRTSGSAQQKQKDQGESATRARLKRRVNQV